MKLVKLLGVIVASLALVFLGGQAANAATAHTYSINITSSDGGAQLTGTVTFLSGTSWKYDVTLHDLKGDGYSPSSQLWEEEVDQNDSFIQEHCLGGSGSTCEYVHSYTEPSTVEQIQPFVCNGPISPESTKCSETAKYGSQIFNPYA